MPCVIGLTLFDATQRLESLGFEVHVIEYVSKRGIKDADSTRVVRQRETGGRTVELTVSHFKTRICGQEQQ